MTTKTDNSNSTNKTQISQASTIKNKGGSSLANSTIFKINELCEHLNVQQLPENIKNKTLDVDLKMSLELLYHKELKSESSDLNRLESYVDEIYAIFDNFIVKCKRDVKMVVIGSFLTNSLRKNHYEVDFCLVHEEFNYDILENWKQVLIQDQRMDAVTITDVKELNFIKVYRENEKNNKEISFNFYDYNLSDERKKRSFLRSLKLNQDYVNFVTAFENEDLTILRAILKNWAFNIFCYTSLNIFFIKNKDSQDPRF